MRLVLLPASAHFPHSVLPSEGQPVCWRVLTVCGGCQPHPEEFYRVCSRTATGDAWPSEILASLPLPAGERGDNGINIPVDSVSLGKRGETLAKLQLVTGWWKWENGKRIALCNYKTRQPASKASSGVVTKSACPLKCRKMIHPENVMRGYGGTRRSETVLIVTSSPVELNI